jgi:hypothetical protein
VNWWMMARQPRGKEKRRQSQQRRIEEDANNAIWGERRGETWSGQMGLERRERVRAFPRVEQLLRAECGLGPSSDSQLFLVARWFLLLSGCYCCCCCCCLLLAADAGGVFVPTILRSR